MTQAFVEITERDFRTLGKMLTARYGIKLPPEKRVMFQARLQSRLRQLEIDSFETYCDFILNPKNTDAELEKMITFISTNKTEFFRVDQHFQFLQAVVLPVVTKKANENSLNCWSAGCSRGQEAFSMAMVIDSYLQQNTVDFNFSILGTDVSEQVLTIAKKGIYPFKESKSIPDHFLKNYVLKSKDQSNPRIKMVNALRRRIRFQYGNLMDEDYQLKTSFQIIFIRNTLIYFDTENQTEILKKALQYLEPGGYLFIGHSESLINRNLPIHIIAPSIYQKL